MTDVWWSVGSAGVPNTLFQKAGNCLLSKKGPESPPRKFSANLKSLTSVWTFQVSRSTSTNFFHFRYSFFNIKMIYLSNDFYYLHFSVIGRNSNRSSSNLCIVFLKESFDRKLNFMVGHLPSPIFMWQSFTLVFLSGNNLMDDSAL